MKASALPLVCGRRGGELVAGAGLSQCALEESRVSVGVGAIGHDPVDMDALVAKVAGRGEQEAGRRPVSGSFRTGPLGRGICSR